MPDKDSVDGHDDRSLGGQLEKSLPVTAEGAETKPNCDEAESSPTAALGDVEQNLQAADFISPAIVSIVVKSLTAEDFIYPIDPDVSDQAFRPASPSLERAVESAELTQLSDRTDRFEPMPRRAPLLERMGLPIADVATLRPEPPPDEIVEVASSPCFLNEVDDAFSQRDAEAQSVPVEADAVVSPSPIEQTPPEPPPPLPPEPRPAPLQCERPLEVPPSRQHKPEYTGEISPLEQPLGEAAPPETVRPAPAARSSWSPLRTAATWLLRGFAAYAAAVFCLIVLFRFADPPGSALMAWRWIGGTDIQTSWVPIGTMSPYLVQAVVVSEDGTFCTHNGIDIDAIQDAIEKSSDGIPRGASTISMQVTKNMFLWPSKSYVRKAIEIPLTLIMELIWPKQRILEVYLNIAEWGPGIFGAEAAAQYHFQKPASSLTPREAAQLAASLPNPFRRDAGDPGPRTARKANTIQARMRAESGAASCAFTSREAVATKTR